MTSFGQSNNQLKSASQKQTNPFASSLLENEKKIDKPALSTNQADEVFNPFANALLNSPGATSDFNNQEFLQKQQKEALQAQRRDALRKKLHDRVNPVNTYELFSAKEEKSKEELNNVRRELELLIGDLKDLSSDISIVVNQDVVNPGIDGGSYYQNFFHQLRQLIMLMRQKVSSARSWSMQMRAKGKKKQGLNYKKTKDVQASINNERNSGANAVA